MFRLSSIYDLSILKSEFLVGLRLKKKMRLLFSLILCFCNLQGLYPLFETSTGM